MNVKPRKTPIGTQQVRHAKAARAHISEPRQGLHARRDPAQERSRQTVDAIVEAAGRLLVEHGRLGVTTNAVAERAGVSIGSLYQYYTRNCRPLNYWVHVAELNMGSAVFSLTWQIGVKLQISEQGRSKATTPSATQ